MNMLLEALFVDVLPALGAADHALFVLFNAVFLVPNLVQSRLGVRESIVMDMKIRGMGLLKTPALDFANHLVVNFNRVSSGRTLETLLKLVVRR